MAEGLTAVEAFFIAIITLVLVFSIVSNITVIIIMIKTPKLRNITNLFICNLSISDILLAGVVLPQNLHDLSHTEDYFEGDFLCRFVNVTPILLITGSIYTLVAIAFERRGALVLNLEPPKPIPVILKSVPAIWIMSFVICIPTIFEYKEYTFLDGNVTRYSCGRLDEHFPLVYSISNGFMILIVSYVIPLILLMYNYSQIFRYFWKSKEEMKHEVESARNKSQRKHRLQVIKMLILVAAFFVVAWLPYFIILIIAKISGKDDSEAYSGPINVLRIILAAFSTAYNVILYAIYNRNFREAFMSTFKRFRKSHVSPLESTITQKDRSRQANSFVDKQTLNTYNSKQEPSCSSEAKKLDTESANDVEITPSNDKLFLSPSKVADLNINLKNHENEDTP
ncbi:hypothetical protein LOTGIDRAFT_166607 [Lottia gigantea]|uniref:G-protein coupled receptors family 1 profile domain-containing protein n=1 Tax=Lottia gigantea TaxID=225164 RepID=V4BF26_LOTGI|nr:hypothetical protein LOTGIDRAFT_166607 [Lottia gigantea]ESO87454.1 hypothetical protein LOTGIDRAFT_166607 [Lottia gigantea]